MAKAQRNKQLKQRSKKGKRRKVLRVILLIILILLLVGAASIFVFNKYAEKVIEESATKDLETDNIYSLIYQRSMIYDSKGKEVDALYLSGGNRTLIEYNDLPQELIDAVIDTEDKTFWEHNGFNYIRILGAIKEKIFGGGQISGTSTITQQLARNIYLSEIKSERTLNRKILEAYYTKILEEELSKKEILEAYFNTVYFGFNSYGIAAASQSYFGKKPKKLSLVECVALAALPQAPDTYALVKTTYSQKNSEDLPVITKGNGYVYLYNGAASENRRKIILSNMLKNEHISELQYQKALGTSLEKHIKLNSGKNRGAYSYYIDCAVDEAVKDMAKKYDITEEEARTRIYTQGYHIYTCLDKKVQKTLDSEINTSSNYATINTIRKDGNGNIISPSGEILMRPYSYYFEKNGKLKLTKKEYRKADDGTITLMKGKRLLFYEASAGGSKYVSVEFREMYREDDGALYFYEGGSLSIPAGYTSFDEDGNCVVSAAFREEFPNFFKKRHGKLIVSKSNRQLGPKMRQPQAAAVIIDNENGRVIAITGGRGASGKQLYNRATNPRQPGSSIKPIAVYAPALQKSAELAKKGKKMNLSAKDGDRWGNYITAGSVINDAPMTYQGKIWPQNDYGTFRGPMTLRRAVQQSVNVVAVKVFRQIGVDYSIKMLKKNGISSLVLKGNTTDNHDALALGGMTQGISPLEMTAAYATFANKGVYREPIFYTKITDNKGKVILKNKQSSRRVYDESVAWIMTNILKSAVQYGTGYNAQVAGQDVAGKTGTTSSKYDIWFSGFTPRYSMALWMGSDVNIALDNYSSTAAAFWSKIMTGACKDLPQQHFYDKPSDVYWMSGEYYVKGTDPPPPPPEEKDKDKDKKDKKDKDKKGKKDDTTSETDKDKDKD